MLAPVTLFSERAAVLTVGANGRHAPRGAEELGQAGHAGDYLPLTLDQMRERYTASAVA
jgi:hypothetical protein